MPFGTAIASASAEGLGLMWMISLVVVIELWLFFLMVGSTSMFSMDGMVEAMELGAGAGERTMVLEEEIIVG